MRRIRIDQIGDYSEEQINTLLSVAVLTGDRIVKEGSPVDSGRLAVSWQIGENAESGTPASEGKYGSSGKGTVIRPLGTSLPPSWGGTYRSNQGLSAKHLDLLAKELSNEIQDLYKQIRGK